MDQRLIRMIWVRFRERKLRSSLTVLGILIGITALVGLILLSSGLKEGVTKQLDVFGADEILLSAKSNIGFQGPSGYGTLTTDDVRTLDAIPQILSVDSLLQSNMEVRYGREKVRLSISGVGNDAGDTDRTAEEYFDQDILAGRYMEDSDRYVANIGYRIAYETFDKDVLVGTSLEIGGDKYRVIGIFEEEGDISSDNIIYVPIESLRDTVEDSKAITALIAKIAPGTDIDMMVERVKSKLERKRGRDDIAVTTPKQIKEQINSLIGVIDFVVIAIALISLFVGALGIMNSMYTAVLQRVREIGIMKAVGAKNSQILTLFLIESAFLGFFGGVLGVILGFILAFGFIAVINTFGFIKLVLEPDLVLFVGAVAFSTILGILSGFLPAVRASKLKIVDALRYE